MLKQKVFFVSRPSLKMFCSVYYQSQVHSKYFCWTVRLENFTPWILLVTTIYTCCKSITHLTENIFCFMARLENIFAVYIIRQTSLTARLKNMILWGLSVRAIIHLKRKVSFIWYQAAVILKPWYGACLLIYIMPLYILFLHYTLFIFLISIHIVIQPSVHWHSALLARQAWATSIQYEAKELWITHNHMHP